MFYPKDIARKFDTAVVTASAHFGVSEDVAFQKLIMVLWANWLITGRQRPFDKDAPSPEYDHFLRALELGLQKEFTQTDEIVITCELCQNEQWWRDNYGPVWDWARWWHCGPLGLDCPNPPA